MGWHLNPGTEDCPCEHHKSTPRGLLGPASEHHLLCASEQNDMEDFPGRAALVWIRCCLARPSSAREKHLCSASLCILASCSGGQQLFWGRGEQVKFRCVCGEMAKGRGTKSWTRLGDFTFTFHFHTLEKEMETHSSVLAWRIPGTGERGGLPSMGLHRVRHD